MILDEPAVRAIADLLGSEVHTAPFEVRKLGRGHEGQPATEPGPVFQMSVRSQELGEPLLITLWPSLSRVDVRLGQSYWALALRGITSVELYPGVEVLFRRDNPSAFLFVSVKGRVALVA